jgi:hypothetical protein
MFYSIQNVWESVSAKNMADVRELTPEFYFLPDFLTNVNSAWSHVPPWIRKKAALNGWRRMRYDATVMADE